VIWLVYQPTDSTNRLGIKRSAWKQGSHSNNKSILAGFHADQQ